MRYGIHRVPIKVNNKIADIISQADVVQFLSHSPHFQELVRIKIIL